MNLHSLFTLQSGRDLRPKCHLPARQRTALHPYSGTNLLWGVLQQVTEGHWSPTEAPPRPTRPPWLLTRQGHSSSRTSPPFTLRGAAAGDHHHTQLPRH